MTHAEPDCSKCVSYEVTQATSLKVRIAQLWLVVAAMVICAEFVIPFLKGRSSAPRVYYMRAVEYDSGIRIFHYLEDEDVIQSFVEDGDPDGYTYLGTLTIGKYPRTEFELFRPWVSSEGVSQISPVFSHSARRLLTHDELSDLVLKEAMSSLNSDDPLWEFERMQATGFLNLISNNSAPIRKTHPANMVMDLLIVVIIAGAVYCAVYLSRLRIANLNAGNSESSCPSCGYSRADLGSDTPCPECGRSFLSE